MSDEEIEILEEDAEDTTVADTNDGQATDPSNEPSDDPSNETSDDPDPPTFSVTFDFREYEANQLLDMAVDDDSTSVTIEGVDSDHGASLTPVSGWSVRNYDDLTQIWSLTDDKLLGWSSDPDSNLIYFKPDDKIYADTDNMTLYSVYAKSIVANIRYHNNFVPNVVIEDERFLIGGTHELSAVGDLQGFDNVGYSFVKWDSDSEYVPYYDRSENKWKIDIYPNDEISAVDIDLSASWGRLKADLYYNNNISGSSEVSVADHRNSFSTGTYALSSTDALGNDFKNPGYVFNGWTAESDLMVDVFYDDTSNQWKITLPPELEKVDIMIWMDTCQASITNGLIPTLKNQIRAVFSANPENRIALVQTANSSYSVGEGANYYLVPDAATDKDRGPTIDFTNNEETLLAAIDLISAFNSPGVTNHNAENLWNSIFAATDVQHFSWSNDGRRKILIAITDEPCDCYNYVRRKLINGTVSTHHQIQGETIEGLLFGNTSGIQPNYDYSTVGVHTSPEEFVTLLLNNNLEFYFFGCIMPNYTEPQKTNEGKYLGFLDNEIVQPLIAQNGTGRTYNASMSTLARDIESLFRFDLSHTITLRANWAKEYKIRYHANYDGAQPEVIVDDRSIIDSDTIQLEENQFTRPAEGFTWGFVGWSKTPDGEISYVDKDFVYFDIEEGDLDLYAVWDKALNFNIFYHKEQNDDGIEDYRNPITAEGSYNLVPNSFVKAGYDFIGWNTSADGSGDSYVDGATINVSSTGILNLYAQWNASDVIVSFLPGRTGIAGTMESVNTHANPAEYTVPQCGYHDDRGYYVFTKWRVNDGNQTFYYEPGYRFAEKIDPKTGIVTDDRLTHDITMIAEWKYNGDMPETECSDLDPDYKDGGPKDGRKYVVENLCKIVFYSGWGDNESYEQCCALGFKTYLMPEQFSEKRPGYKFMGWGVAMNDDVVYEDQDLYLPTQCPSYLYGQWKKEGDDGPDVDVDEEACIVGYDPFPVVFRDMSDVRSFKTKYWRWDFGDSIVYGCDTSATTTADFEDPDSLYGRFSLPGDDVVYDLGKSKTINCELLFKNNIDYFHDVLPQCLMNIDYYDWDSYHYEGPRDPCEIMMWFDNTGSINANVYRSGLNSTLSSVFTKLHEINQNCKIGAIGSRGDLIIDTDGTSYSSHVCPNYSFRCDFTNSQDEFNSIVFAGGATHVDAWGEPNWEIGNYGITVYGSDSVEDAWCVIDTLYNEKWGQRNGSSRFVYEAVEFSTNVTYPIGVFVYRSGKIYKCIHQHQRGDWDANNFEESTIRLFSPNDTYVQNELVWSNAMYSRWILYKCVDEGGHTGPFDPSKLRIPQNVFSTSKSYQVNDYVIRSTGDHTIYRFIVDHPVNTAWNTNHVEFVAAQHSTTISYSVGDYVIYDNVLWVRISNNKPASGSWASIKNDFVSVVSIFISTRYNAGVCGGRFSWSEGLHTRKILIAVTDECWDGYCSLADWGFFNNDSGTRGADSANRTPAGVKEILERYNAEMYFVYTYDAGGSATKYLQVPHVGDKLKKNGNINNPVCTYVGPAPISVAYSRNKMVVRNPNGAETTDWVWNYTPYYGPDEEGGTDPHLLHVGDEVYKAGYLQLKNDSFPKYTYLRQNTDNLNQGIFINSSGGTETINYQDVFTQTTLDEFRHRFISRDDAAFERLENNIAAICGGKFTPVRCKTNQIGEVLKNIVYRQEKRIKHFTGINFKSHTESTSGSGFIDYTNYDVETTVSHQHRFRRLPNDRFTTWIGVTGIDDKILPDQCARIACEQEYDFGNSVAHVYKGPGLYYSTMVCSSENQSAKEAGLQGMELASYIYDADVTPEDKQMVAGCWINVLPVCPCVSGFHVYGTYQGNDWAPDTTPYNSTNRKFLTVTNSNYSCDDEISAATGYVGWNCNVTFTDFDGNERTTKCVSGYAPYLQIGASGVLAPRSLPVTGAWFDWSDWNSDYMDKDHRFFGEVIRGWPTWATKPLDASGNVIWDAPEEALHNVSGDHVYTLPGLYSVGISPEFDKERIRRYMPTVRDYEYCAEETLKKSASGCCVLVVEIPPKFETRGFDWVEPPPEERKKVTEVSGFHANVRAGSYPISRIDWDFGDGSEILSISTEGYRVKDKDVIENFGYGYVNYDSELNTIRRDLPESALHKTTTGYLNGNSKRNCFECKDSDDNSFEYERNPYDRRDARDYLINHKYIRTNIDDGILTHQDGTTGYGYMVRVSAYAENTNTCVVYEYPILTGGVGLPDFDEEEGFVEMVDIRTDSTTETNVVLQSKKEDRLYVNRIIETNESYVPVPVVEPELPSGDTPSGDGDEESKTYYCLLAPEEVIDTATTYPPETVQLKSKFNMCIDVTNPSNITVSGLHLFTDYKAGSRVFTTNSGNSRVWAKTHVVRISTTGVVGNATMTTDGDNWRVEIPVALTWVPTERINRSNPQQTINHNLSQLEQDLNLSGYGQNLVPKIVISGDKSTAFVDLMVANNFNAEMAVMSNEQPWWYLRPDDPGAGYGSIMHRECQYVQTIDS